MSNPHKMTSRDVRRAFKKHWEDVRRDHPNYEDDRPIKAFVFTCFVDNLHRAGRISDRVAEGVTLEEPK